MRVSAARLPASVTRRRVAAPVRIFRPPAPRTLCAAVHVLLQDARRILHRQLVAGKGNHAAAQGEVQII